ncbi:MAG: hypothetical protein AB7S50_00505 [Bacteroidales bacterium]
MNSRILRFVYIAIVLVLTYGFITYKIIRFEELTSFDYSILLNRPSSLLLIFLILLLMIINWSIETLKWQKLILSLQNIAFINSFKAVIAGVSIGLFTPNRVGEIGGRILFLEKGNRTAGAFASAIGSFAQFVATILMGIIGFVLFLLLFPEKTHINPILNKSLAIIFTFFLFILTWGYYHIKRIVPRLLTFSFFKKREAPFRAISHLPSKTSTTVLALSILRYLVFSIQFFLLLRLFNVHISLIEGAVSISMTYLFMTIIPTTTLLELGLRGSLAIIFIGLFSENIVGIVMASIFLWIINIAIPAVIGTFYLIKPKSLNLS